MGWEKGQRTLREQRGGKERNEKARKAPFDGTGKSIADRFTKKGSDEGDLDTRKKNKLTRGGPSQTRTEGWPLIRTKDVAENPPKKK